MWASRPEGPTFFPPWAERELWGLVGFFRPAFVIIYKWWFWTLIGVGTAAAATGIALGVRAATNSDPSNIEIRNVF